MHSWLYASDEVVEAINNLVHLVIESKGTSPDPEVGRKAVGEIVLAMHHDLLKTTTLSYNSFRDIQMFLNSKVERISEAPSVHDITPADSGRKLKIQSLQC